MPRRTYVSVLARFDENGEIMPLSVKLHDRTYEIDRVLAHRMATATKAGGQGLRYTIRIREQITYLFLDEHHRWFVEEKDHVRQVLPDGCA